MSARANLVHFAHSADDLAMVRDLRPYNVRDPGGEPFVVGCRRAHSSVHLLAEVQDVATLFQVREVALELDLHLNIGNVKSTSGKPSIAMCGGIACVAPSG